MPAVKKRSSYFALAAFLAAYCFASDSPAAEIAAGRDSTTSASGADGKEQKAAVAAEEKDSWVALILSSGGAAVSMLASAAGARSESVNDRTRLSLSMVGGISLFFTPALGHFYTEEPEKAITLTVARVGFRATSFVGPIIKGDADPLCFFIGDDFSSGGHGVKNCRSKSGEAIRWISYMGFWTATFYDIIDAPFSAVRYNERQHKKESKKSNFIVTPWVLPSEGGTAAGLTLTLRQQ